MQLKNRLGRVYAPYKVDFIERDVRPLADDEALIRIKASAICGSDLHIFKGKHPSAPLPVTIGHEMSGTIEAVGAGVTKFAAGDRVTVEPCIVCGKCDACRHGEYSFCEHISFTYRNGDGAMADYIVIKEPYIYKLPERLSFEEGSLIEPLSVATHAVRRADIKLGERVAVMGAGAIGLMVTALCRLSGASDIIVSDASAHRLEVAREFGATATVLAPGEDIVEAVAARTNGKGVDKSFECVGREQTFVQAMKTLRKNGLATIVGIFEQPDITIPAARFITHEIRVQGAQGYCFDFPVALEASEHIDLRRLITHEFPMQDLQKALETCLDRDSGAIKVVLKPSQK
ncbi:MAG: alcohol dehydrogenase catalytic domain-containing protein [Oscillospiraceae bacterium]|nr:alcohol dehydrogenase catalytic domain-containing protein [Oscillospiraceae bacterium]